MDIVKSPKLDVWAVVLASLQPAAFAAIEQMIAVPAVALCGGKRRSIAAVGERVP
ncbi:hypothetical protein [Serratia quinivorans]|uniref:hypothetical protein n=1 Tax=Serratia quinivorans TaxID=137545 RepID=UPI0021B6FCA1|nr:hypothetical protein [Serratia quinivorans]